MPVVKDPLHCAAAIGSFAKRITFFQFRGATIARNYAVPTNPRTKAQTDNRQQFKDAALQFLLLSEKQRAGWRRLAFKYTKLKHDFCPQPHEQDYFISANVYRKLCQRTYLYDPPTETRRMGAKGPASGLYNESANAAWVTFEHHHDRPGVESSWALYMSPPRYESQIPHESLLHFQSMTTCRSLAYPCCFCYSTVEVAPPPGAPPILGNWVRIFLMINGWLASPGFTTWVTWTYI